MTDASLDDWAGRIEAAAKEHSLSQSQMFALDGIASNALRYSGAEQWTKGLRLAGLTAKTRKALVGKGHITDADPPTVTALGITTAKAAYGVVTGEDWDSAMARFGGEDEEIEAASSSADS